MNSRSRKFFSYYRPYLGMFWVDMVCALILSATALALPLCVRYITKQVLEGNGPDRLQQIFAVGGLMLGLIIVYTLCDMFVAYQGHLMGAHMEADMRNELFEHYQKLSFSFYDGQKTGQLLTRITNDSFNLSELFHHGPEDVVISLLNFAGAFIILVNINRQLAIIVLLFLPLMALYAFHFNQRMKRTMRRSRDRVGDINAQVEDALAGIRAIKSFTNEEIETERFIHENSRLVEARQESIKNETLFYEGLIAFTQLMSLVVVVFGGVAIVNGSLDLADLITFLLYIAILIEPIKRFGNFTRLYQEGMAGFGRFMEVLEVEPDIVDAADAIELPHARGAIEFKNVSFRYQGSHGDVLQNISLNIAVGEYVALVGPSGVGKTTLCSLIPRFYQVDAGHILLDGVNIDRIRLRSLRRNIRIVQQDVYLFAGTVAENIRYGKLDASQEEIIAAAKKANAHDFVMALPKGYDTDIGERGVKLSGGQKQRLSIARVFLKDPPVIIFDEATSSLDNESEKAVQDSLERLTANRTTLVIAHRLSTVRNAQRIVVLTYDGIDEQGTHEELLAAGGTYANLYNMQFTI